MQEFRFDLVDDGTFCLSRYTGNEAHVVIPETNCGGRITILFDRLFRGHTELESVKIPDTVTDMGEFMFEGCEKLRHIELSSHLEHLWGYTFFSCGIEEIILPDKLMSIPPFAFKDCKNLKRVVCGKGLWKVHSWAFGGCDQLTEFIHGDNVIISPQAFEDKEVNTYKSKL